MFSYYRSDCLDDYRKIHPSDVINREGKARFGPYSSYATLHSSSSHQELSSVSLHSGREHQREIKREMSQGKKLPVVTIDYNYGLPLDYASEEEDRAHYDSRTTEHYILKWIGRVPACIIVLYSCILTKFPLRLKKLHYHSTLQKISVTSLVHFFPI